MNKKRKSSSARSTKSGMLAKYKGMPTKGNLKGTGLKTLVDLVLGGTLGAALGAVSGRAAVPVGILLIASGHYFDEDSGTLRVIGGGTIAYGIAKAIANKNLADENAVNGFTLAGETSKAKTRLSDFKDELMAAYYLDKVFKKKEKSAEVEDEGAVGSIDVSALDVFELNNHNEAVRFARSEDNQTLISGGFEDEEDYDDEDWDDPYDVPTPSVYGLYDDPDLTNI